MQEIKSTQQNNQGAYLEKKNGVSAYNVFCLDTHRDQKCDLVQTTQSNGG